MTMLSGLNPKNVFSFLIVNLIAMASFADFQLVWPNPRASRLALRPGMLVVWHLPSTGLFASCSTLKVDREISKTYFYCIYESLRGNTSTDGALIVRDFTELSQGLNVSWKSNAYVAYTMDKSETPRKLPIELVRSERNRFSLRYLDLPAGARAQDVLMKNFRINPASLGQGSTEKE